MRVIHKIYYILVLIVILGALEVFAHQNNCLLECSIIITLGVILGIRKYIKERTVKNENRTE